MKRLMTNVAVLMMMALFVGGAFYGVTIDQATADNSYKRIIMRGKLLSSVVWSASGSLDTIGSLFSTAAYDTADYPNDRPDQSRSMRGPLVCWSMLDQLVSAGVTLDDSAVSVFIQHAPNNVEAEFTNLMYLSSANRLLAAGPGNGLNVGRATLDSTMSTTNQMLAMAKVTDGGFGRYLRARFILTTQGGSGVNRNSGYRTWVQCDLSGDSIVR